MNRYNPWKRHGLKNHMVLVDNPHPQSPAAGVKLRVQLLREALRKGDEWDYFFWAKFRNRWLGKQRLLEGTLKCFYCHKDDLKIETEKLDTLATIDHFRPVSKGGGMFDEENLRVCCRTCNQQKGDKMPKELAG